MVRVIVSGTSTMTFASGVGRSWLPSRRSIAPTLLGSYHAGYRQPHRLDQPPILSGILQIKPDFVERERALSGLLQRLKRAGVDLRQRKRLADLDLPDVGLDESPLHSLELDQ